MPQNLQQVVFNSCTSTVFAGIATKDQNAIYYLSDTHQIFVGGEEFTKSVKGLNATPTASTPGDAGRLYYYDGNLYACGGLSEGDYIWTRVANINDVVGSVTSIGAGEGLGVADGSTNPITTAGSLVHAIPSGASTHSDAGAAQTPGFGSTFAVETIATDKFGHVTAISENTVTLPTETEVSVTDGTAQASTLEFGSTFTALTNVAKGTGSHEIEQVETVFTIPELPAATTYAISSDAEGTVTLTPSQGSAQTITIDGWSDLAKKSELAAVFVFKGTVATVSALPTVAEVGWVYHVTAANAEYVCVTASTETTDAVWEELGTTIDLSGYMEKVTTATTGDIAIFAADGSVIDSGMTTANATTATAGFMSAADKEKLDGIEAGAEVNAIETISVDGTTLSIDANRDVALTLADFSQVTQSGGVTTIAANLTGTATTATIAVNDANGAQIDTTYATKASVSWNVIS